MTSFKLNFCQKVLRFWKVSSGNLKIRKLSVILTPSNFQELFVIKFDSKLSYSKLQSCSEGIYHEKAERGRKCLSSYV